MSKQAKQTDGLADSLLEPIEDIPQTDGESTDEVVSELESDKKQEGADSTVTDESEMIPGLDADIDQKADNVPFAPTVLTPPHQPWPKRAWHWCATHKKVTIPAVVALVCGLLAAIPATRYALAGTVLTQTYRVTVVDATTKKPVSNAQVVIADQKVITNNKGEARAKVAVGDVTIEVSKTYYKKTDRAVRVPIFEQKDVPQIRLQATGRQVPVTVTNKIGRTALANVTLKADKAEATTDKDGKAVLVVPAGKDTVEVTFTAKDFNTRTQTIAVNAGAQKDTAVELTPSGSLYFLSNQSGKMDVVKTDLDGENRQVVLAGTGKEDKNDTYLSVSSDAQYLALQARRDSAIAKLYLIETATNKLSVMDEGDAWFQHIGWSGNRYVYKVSRTKIQYWQPKREALKTYDAATRKLTTLDESQAAGDQYRYTSEYFSFTKLMGDELVFLKRAQFNGYFYPQMQVDQQSTFGSIRLQTNAKKTHKTFALKLADKLTSTDARADGFRTVKVLYDKATGNEADNEYYEYTDGKLTKVQSTNGAFYNYDDQRTVYTSLSGNRTAWAEVRDGKMVFFTGDKDAQNEQRLGDLSTEYWLRGWHGDSYLLLGGRSNYYIVPAMSLGDPESFVKLPASQATYQQ